MSMTATKQLLVCIYEVKGQTSICPSCFLNKSDSHKYIIF
jgi:hypothetical protein